MHAILLFMAVSLAAQTGQVEATSTPQTRIYVRTVPAGASIEVDGKRLGPSDGLFLVPPGVRRVTIEMDGYDPETRKIDVRDGWITRVEVKLKKNVKNGEQGALPPSGSHGGPPSLDRVGGGGGPPSAISLMHGNNTSEGMRSLAGSGHAVKFDRDGWPKDFNTITNVNLFASRYGDPEPPREDFHIYLLDDQGQMLRDVPVPYAKIKRTGELRWCSFHVPATRVPEKFMVALSFNPHQTKGIYLGYDSDVKESHSYTGLPSRGFTAVSEKYDWMVQATLMRGSDMTQPVHDPTPVGSVTVGPSPSQPGLSDPWLNANAPPGGGPTGPSPKPTNAPDPFAQAPADPEIQAKAIWILQRMVAMNRYWLVSPPEAVKNYAFRYTLSKEKPKDYVVPDVSKARTSLLWGTTYYSGLHVLVDHPEDATFRKVKKGHETITIDYELAEPIHAAYGNGVEGHWYGYFEREIRGGTLVLDAKTYAPLTHQCGEVKETFSDYARVGIGARAAPRQITINGGSLVFFWRFDVYDPGLWILHDGWCSTDGGAMEVFARLEMLKINGAEPRSRTTPDGLTLSAKILGPTTAKVGDEVSFEIVLANRSKTTATGLVCRTEFSPGLVHDASDGPIERSLPNLAPGKTHRIGMKLRAAQPGDPAVLVLVTGDGGLHAVGNAIIHVEPKVKATSPPAKDAPTRNVQTKSPEIVIISLQWLDAKEAIDVVKTLLLLSPQGRAIVVPGKSNQILVSDTPDAVNKIREVFAGIDKPGPADAKKEPAKAKTKKNAPEPTNPPIL